MVAEEDIESLIKRDVALHCSDEPLELIPSLVPTSVAIQTKLVSKLLHTKKLGRNVVRGIYMWSWERENAWTISKVEPNLFIFTFCKEEDKRYVQEQGPWTADGSLLVLKEWSLSTPISAIDFHKTEFWIRVHGFPICYYSKDNATRIGQCEGRVLKLKYEKLGNFYFNSGLVEDEDKDCSSKVPAMVTDSYGKSVQLYGHWMKGISQMVSYFVPNLHHIHQSTGNWKIDSPQCRRNQFLWSQNLSGGGRRYLQPDPINATMVGLVSPSRTSSMLGVPTMVDEENRGGNVFVLDTSASKFNEVVDFLLLPSPAVQYQLTQ
ncbi:hypothetical protein TorRG33x02_308620, partial [Trema orientale]